jgi:SAM-dependent methyltransferase
MAWYREWFGEEYLELYAHRDLSEAQRHARFVVDQLGPLDGLVVLDLACGTGRHAEALAALGGRVLGVDLSRTMLARSSARSRLAAADMRRLPFADGSLDVILNFFTSFGYFERERENFLVLEEIVRTLRVGGRLLIDLMNAELAIANLKPTETVHLGGQQVVVERWYDALTRRINKRLRGADGRSFLESVRAYRRDEVAIGLRWAGLEVVAELGDFDASGFDPTTSPRHILIAEKRA